MGEDPEEGHQDDRGLENLAHEEMLKELGLFTPLFSEMLVRDKKQWA